MGNIQLNTTDFEQDFINVSLITDAGSMSTSIHKLSLMRFVKRVQDLDEIYSKPAGGALNRRQD